MIDTRRAYSGLVGYRFTLNETALRGFEDNRLRGFMASLERTATDEAERECPVSSGATRSTIEGSVTAPGVRPIRIEVTAGGASEFINKGTRPHVIRAKNKKALFNATAGFGPVAGPVNHPGTAPNPFLRRAVSIALVRHGMRPIRP